MKNRVAFEKIVMNISTHFFSMESNEVDKGIQNALQTIGETVEVDHGYIYRFSDNNRNTTKTHEWSSPQTSSRVKQLRDLPMQNLPWITAKLKKGQSVYIPRLADLPPEAMVDKEILQTRGCRSLVLVPMIVGKLCIGFLGFECARSEKVWPEEMIGLLRMVSEILINALERKRTEKELQKSEEKYRNFVENINDVIFSLDEQGRFTYISPVIEQVAFYNAEDLMGQPFAQFVYLEDLPDFLNGLKRILAGDPESHEFRILNKEGSIRHVHISGRRLLEGDHPVGLTGILSDITERKWTEVLLKRAEEKYRSIFQNAVEGIFQSTLDGHFIVANPACARILGYSSPEELIAEDADSPRQYFVDQEAFGEFQRLIEEQGLVQKYEAQVYRKDGSKIWISIKALAIRDSNRKVLFYEGTIEDITERKWADDQIRYLSFHDKLTGLYNRSYFEEELKRLDTERQLPISVIMGDVNGLKLVNDAFGHQEGDKLLTRIASIIKDSCRKEDVIARLGGDEFAIFLPRTNYRVATVIVDRIKLACGQASHDPVHLSIALGVVTKEDSDQDIQEILKEAEERMYRSKLLESKSVRASILTSLRRTLFEKSHETEEHTYRLQQLALRIGRAYGMSDSELDDLALLATLHDIGKIAIPEGIIVKPGDLSSEEWELIWKHPEIGYRIAGASPELAPIAEAILAHHEWWDGSGYPRGLKVTEIPLISRIVAIVDAYDVMTHGRPYKESVNEEEALKELQRMAGTQFDPELIAVFMNMLNEEHKNQKI